jgi:hypothetical protein
MHPTRRYGVAIGSSLAPLVRALMLVLSPVTWPLGKLLDMVLGHEDVTMKRRQLKAMVQLHAEGAGAARVCALRVPAGRCARVVACVTNCVCWLARVVRCRARRHTLPWVSRSHRCAGPRSRGLHGRASRHQQPTARGCAHTTRMHAQVWEAS